MRGGHDTYVRGHVANRGKFLADQKGRTCSAYLTLWLMRCTRMPNRINVEVGWLVVEAYEGRPVVAVINCRIWDKKTNKKQDKNE
jgi:hypothetical protein